MKIEIGTIGGVFTIECDDYKYNTQDKTITCFNNNIRGGQQNVAVANYIYFIIKER